MGKRNPNGYGTVYKLPGNRRKPFIARVTIGWKYYDRLTKASLENIPDDCDPFEMLSDGEHRFINKQIYQTVGYYPTRQEAMIALAEYNTDPHDLHLDTITFEEVYKKWSEIHFQKIKNTNGYKAAFQTCKDIWNMKLAEIKLDHLQKVCDESGKNTPTLKTMKNMWGLMYDYAVIHEIVTPDKRDMVRFVDINKPGNPNALNRHPFTKKETKQLWDAQPSNQYVSIVLILIYTGLRIGELLELEKKDVHLEERWFFVQESKTSAGVREVPIAEKVAPFFEYWMQKDCDHLVCTPDEKPFTYRNYYDSYWIPLMLQMNMGKYVVEEGKKEPVYDGHRPHDARHTCVSLLTEAKVDERIIQKIIGHKGQNVTQIVYTHVDLPAKLEAINLI